MTAAPPTGKAGIYSNELLSDEAVESATFESLGLCKEICAACAAGGWNNPTRIQAATIPVALMGQDLVGVAQTGSGKTGAFVLPIVHWLLTQPKPPFLSALILVPTRELALQVAEQCTMLGSSIGLQSVVLVGGVDMVDQACALMKRPHVVIGTPGRVRDHFLNTKGFHMRKLKWLVLDEADKMLEMDYGVELEGILSQLPADRQAMLFSATLSTKIDRLQKAALKNPKLLEVHRKNSTVQTLSQFFVFCPFDSMLVYLHLVLTKILSAASSGVTTAGDGSAKKKKKTIGEAATTDDTAAPVRVTAQGAAEHIIIFCSAAHLVSKVTRALRILGHRALPLMGAMTQENRCAVLQQFKEGSIRILVATDVAQRGLDIQHCDVVINYGLPLAVKDYIHRVGRTARAGQVGKAINVMSQYDIELLQQVEEATQVTMEEIAIAEADVEDVRQRVEDAELEAKRELKETEQEEKLINEENQAAGVRSVKRARSSNSGGQNNSHRGGGAAGKISDRMGLDDAKHGGQEGSFAMMRMRRENEAKYAATKKTMKKGLYQQKRQHA